MGLDQYIRHAKRYGTAGVYESANDLGPSDLHRLAIELKSIDPDWKPQRDDAVALICRLASTVPEQELADVLGIRVSTLRRWALEKCQYVVPDEPLG